jgi:hypothetical protein
VADIAITCGAFAVLLSMYQQERRAKRGRNKQASGAK